MSEIKLLPAPKNLPQSAKTPLIDRLISTKTFILSHLAILFIGLGANVYLYTYLHPKSNTPITAGTLGNQIAVTKAQNSFHLEIISPENNIITSTNQVTLKGQTSSFANLIITQENTNSTLQAQADGTFYTDLTLKEGLNTIQVTSFNSKGANKTLKRQIYYTKQTS